MGEYKDSVEVLRDALKLSQRAQTVHAIVPTLALETALMWVDSYSKMMDSLREEAEQEAAALRAEVERLRARVAELEAETSQEITVVEARLEAQRKRLTRWTKQTNDL